MTDRIFSPTGGSGGLSREFDRDRVSAAEAARLQGLADFYARTATVAPTPDGGGSGPQPRRSGGGGSGGGGGRRGVAGSSFTAAVIPTGGSLVKVVAPAGSDADMLFFVEWVANGVPLLYEIGDQARFDDLFRVDDFDNIRTVDQAGFDAIGGVEMGLIDEQLGNTESIQSQVEDGVREAGFTDIPQWIKDSPQLMTILAEGTAEQWDSGRILTTMARTDDFKARFPGFEEFRSARLAGTATIQEALDAYVGEEQGLRSAIQQIRGVQADVSTDYLGTLIATGWTAREAAQVLEGERRLRQRPDALVRVNQLLSASGMDPLSGTDFLEMMRGNAQPQVYEVINDALRREALAEQGVEVTADQAEALGTGSSPGVAAEGAFDDAARNAAVSLLVNQRELDFAKLGVTRDDVLAFAFGEGTSGEVATKLAQFARERTAAGQGFDQFTTFVDQRGRGRIAGLSAL